MKNRGKWSLLFNKAGVKSHNSKNESKITIRACNRGKNAKFPSINSRMLRISEAIKHGELKGNFSPLEPNTGYLSSKPNIGHFRKSFFIIQYNKNNKQCVRVFRKHIAEQCVRVFRKHIAGHQAIESSYY